MATGGAIQISAVTGAGVSKKTKKNVSAAVPQKKSPPSHPKYLAMIGDAISTLKERTGSSQIAIVKIIEDKHRAHLPANFKKMLLVQLRKLTASGKLTKIKNSYKLPSSSAAAVSAPSKPKRKMAATSPAKKRPAPAKKMEVRPAKSAKTSTKDGPAKKVMKTKVTAAPTAKPKKAVKAAKVKKMTPVKPKKVVPAAKAKKAAPVKLKKVAAAKPKSVKSSAKKAPMKKSKK